ncbi:neuraminidase-like domain-containing protein [Nocardia sp. GCM10030253]|uniref:Tc toxin subunit A-related protein n=1 Tax=Nocardia sp. GCM10030253 TaxID=3273404 RepID=UPI00364074FA
MPDLIILRLFPAKPMAPADFTTILTGLKITANDLTFADSVDGVELGSASGLADPHLGSTTNNQVNINNTKLLQHYIDVTDPLGTTTRELESVATAVIVVNTPGGHTEYPTPTSFDLRLELTKGGFTIPHHRLHYNVEVTTRPNLSNSQKIYFGMATSAYVTLPATDAGLDPNLAFVDLPANGQPPAFAQVVRAIDTVLADDPGGPNGTLIRRSPLTVAESRQVAAEIIWNRTAYPPPTPDPRLGIDPFGALYTDPPAEDLLGADDIEKARARFEAELNGYYGTHEAEALRLAGFVYSASAAVAQEVLSITAQRARFDFPLITAAASPTTKQAAGVVLVENGGLTPAYVVPAAYFYALGAQMPGQVGPQQRYDMARFALEPQVLSAFETAVDGGVITVPATPLTVAGPAVAATQAARRLRALGAAANTLTEVPLVAPIETLVADWLAHTGASASINTDFWAPEVAARPGPYLELLLQGITANSGPLIAAIKAPPLNVATVADLVAVNDEQWRDLFAANPALLPPFTVPGTPAERTEAFIRHLRTFFDVQADPGTGAPPVVGAPPELTRSHSDVFEDFMTAYPVYSGGVDFSFATDPDAAAVIAAVTEVFPDDQEARQWLFFALNAIRALWVVTDIGAGELRFALIEALYARGFTAAAQIAALSAADFRYGLSGTVAYGYAFDIYEKAASEQPDQPLPPGPFNPVNPDGSLVDCIPPEHLSPLGPAAYLQEMLRVSAGSSCADPVPYAEDTLGGLLGARRGDLGELAVTKANLATRIPVIDLVNESLEQLVTTVPGATAGAVHDTATYELAGHRLSHDGTVGGHPLAHDPQTLFATVPEHSSPATPVAVPAAYDALRTDFTHPELPYPQALDINRSYLKGLGASRFSAMRHFREDITEFAVDAAHEPATFRSHYWRYPLRLPIALEYLRITPEEYELLYSHDIGTEPAEGRLVLHEVYGYPQPEIGGRSWTEFVRVVPEFLRRTGLDYCEFLELWRSGYVPFRREYDGGETDSDASEGGGFPDCLPCCPEDLVIDFGELDTSDALRHLAVFIRLWCRLREHPCEAVTFAQLTDICTTLELFRAGAVNPDFARQLGALFVLREFLCLPWEDPDAPDPTAESSAPRTHLLALWIGSASPHWDWAVRTLIERIDATAERLHPELSAQPELAKLMAQNLDALSRLAGLDPNTATDTWHRQPTSTIRFAEVLLKIYLSEFTVGEVLFLFADAHLRGDDPFPLPSANEAMDNPLGLPDDDDEHGLWALRHKLLDATAEDVQTWSWGRITDVMEREFGYLATTPDDALQAVGEHFFPSVLEREGIPVTADRRRFSAPLTAADTTPAMWNSPPDGPFHYDRAGQTLWTRLPLDDIAVAERLSTLRPLTAVEQQAVQTLYFAPRTLLAPFGLIFSGFEAAVERLVQEPDEQERFDFVQQEFALFYRRTRIIVEHLAEHVRGAAPQRDPGLSPREVARLLRSLWGDENAGTTPWEDDSGTPPAVTWPTAPTGGAFAALLGLVGTGLAGEFAVAGLDPAWRELSGPLTVFGSDRNTWNAPAPTVIPEMGLTLTPKQLRHVAVRNGFALRDLDGEPLLGAQPFTVTWSGALLVEASGRYEFAAGDPTPDGDEPDCERCEDHRWRITLRRGQRSWILLNRNWPGENAPDCHSAPIELRRGSYEITVELRQPEPIFDRPEEVRPRHTGFQVKYTGPDTEDRLVAVPHRRLYRIHVEAPLDVGVVVGDPAAAYLRSRYTSSLRDIRRTYQRAFKAALLTHRLRLSAATLPREPQSELGYLLDHAEGFAGQSHPRTGATSFGTHRAWFDPDLLPVADPFDTPAADQRSAPSAARQAALFDGWERLYDYTALRQETWTAREKPAWRVFHEASERQPDDPAQLVRHLGVDVRHALLVLTYFDYVVGVPDLENEAWAIRAWRCEMWLDRLERCFRVLHIDAALPHRWAADRPELGPDAGNENLTSFVRDGSFESGAPRRYLDVQTLNDGLRVRARDALVTWLCGMQRVPLPFDPGRYAVRATDLSDLLLQDVATGTCARASRIEDAISGVHGFVQRARLGLEPDLPVSAPFAQLWDGRYETFHTWQCCAEREVYRENWIEWDELDKARRVEAFVFLEDRLRRGRLTTAVPGGLEWWPNRRPPAHPGLTVLQEAEPSVIHALLPGPVPEGMDLQGTPQTDAQPSWLAPLRRITHTDDGEPTDNDNGDGDGDDNDDTDPVVVHSAVAHELATADRDRLPLWIQTAVRLGARFVRVAAAGTPPAAAGFSPCVYDEDACCCGCGRDHEPLVDEYYFWLEHGVVYEPVVQSAEAGRTTADEISDWHRPDKLPTVLHWPAVPVVHLCWSRQRGGRFEPQRRSGQPVRVQSAAHAQLEFKGRTVDSLRFEIIGGIRPTGYDADPTPPGFRYDLATDSTTTLPLIVAPPPPEVSVGGLDAYPFFAYVCPGAPLEPLSLFSVALTVGATLRTHCRYEAALKWYELAQRPGTTDNAWTECRRTPPPTNGNGNGDGDGDGNGDGGVVVVLVESADVDVDAAIADHRREGDVACCSTTAIDDRRARERALLLRYLETMLDWADTLLCRSTPESMRRADVVLAQIDRILGARPDTVMGQDDWYEHTVSSFVPREAPLNPRLTVLYQRTADRLSLIQHCVDGRRLPTGRAGVDRPYFGADPRPDGWCDGDCGCGDDCCGSCCDAYRFTVLVRQARELAGDVRSLGAQLLAAYEKGDAEYLAALHSTQDHQLLELTVEQRRHQWRDADWQVQALGKTKEGAQARLRYYQNLIANGLNAGEIGYESLTGVSVGSRVAGNVVEAIAQGIGMTPDFWIGVAGIAGSPLQFNQIPIGNKLASGFATAARIMNGLSEIATSGANLSNQEGTWDRRLAEWRHQVDTITIELEQIERQILGAERRRDLALGELNNHQRQLENSARVRDFLRDKFTNHELYLYLQQETAAQYYRMYELARCAARKAERAFNYERGYTARKFVGADDFDTLREGLLAGERLHVAVARMDKAYLDENCREYELTKHISMRLCFPLAYLQLQTTGSAEIEVPEWMFDLDYPGHYMRRIKNVSVTIPCVVGPYTGVHCRLTLLSSWTRVDPRLIDPPNTCCHEPPRSGCCCAAAPNGYTATGDDSRMVRSYTATEAIATSTGQNDSGMFELNFRDERYLPFEFAGAISRWRIELPPETNAFDFAALGDLVMHFNITAWEGGEPLRAAALAAARCRLPGDGLRLLDVRRDLPDAWSGLRVPRQGGGPWNRRLDLRLSGAMFPFVPVRRVRWVDSLQLFVQAPCAEPSASVVVRFRPVRYDRCACEWIDVHCVASSEFPGLYWGVVDLDGTRLGPLDDDSAERLGAFEFPDELGEICEAYLVFGYCAETARSCGGDTRCDCRESECSCVEGPR